MYTPSVFLQLQLVDAGYVTCPMSFWPPSAMGWNEESIFLTCLTWGSVRWRCLAALITSWEFFLLVCLFVCFLFVLFVGFCFALLCFVLFFVLLCFLFCFVFCLCFCFLSFGIVQKETGSGFHVFFLFFVLFCFVFFFVLFCFFCFVLFCFRF